MQKFTEDVYQAIKFYIEDLKLSLERLERECECEFGLNLKQLELGVDVKKGGESGKFPEIEEVVYTVYCKECGYDASRARLTNA